MTEQDLLNAALNCGITDMPAILEKIKTMTDKKYLDMHKQKVWCGSNGRFCTHLYKQGKRVLISKGTQEALNNYIIEFYKGSLDVFYVSEVFYEWVSKKLEYGEIGRNTYDKYEATFRRYFKPISNENIKAITEEKLEAFVKKTIHDEKLTAKGWSDVRIVLRGIYKDAKRKGYTTIRIDDFLDDIALSPRIFTRNNVIPEEQVFTDVEANMIINYILSCEKLSTDYGIILSFQTGLRAGELAALKYSDMNGNILNVSRTEIRYKGDGNTVYEVKTTTKGRDGSRKVYLTDEAVKTIEILHELSGKDKLFDCHVSAFTNRLYRICDKLNIPRRSLHKCRKTYATTLVKSGVSDMLVAKMLGHTDPITTYRHYVFSNDEEEVEKAEVNGVIDKWLKNG